MQSRKEVGWPVLDMAGNMGVIVSILGNYLRVRIRRKLVTIHRDRVRCLDRYSTRTAA